MRWCWVDFQCRGVLLIWSRVGQGPTALAVGAGGVCLDMFCLVYHFCFLSPSLWETTRYRLKYCLKGAFSPNQPTKPSYFSFHCALWDSLCYFIPVKSNPGLYSMNSCFPFFSFVATCFFPFSVLVESFSALIYILYLVQVLSRLSTRASSACSSSARASISSANRRLVIFLPPMLTFPSCSSRASDMIRSRKMLKRVGDRSHPCLTPTVVLNHSPMLPFIWTALVALS